MVITVGLPCDDNTFSHHDPLKSQPTTFFFFKEQQESWWTHFPETSLALRKRGGIPEEGNNDKV